MDNIAPEEMILLIREKIENAQKELVERSNNNNDLDGLGDYLYSCFKIW